MPTRDPKFWAIVGTAVVTIAGTISGGVNWGMNADFNSRLAVIEKHAEDGRPHQRADDRIRLLEQGQSSMNTALKNVSSNVNRIEDHIGDVEMVQRDINRKLDVILRSMARDKPPNL